MSHDAHISALSTWCQAYDAEIVRYSIEEWRKYSGFEEFAREFKSVLDESVLLLGLGNYHWVKVFEDYFGVNERILDAIDAGKPFIFQTVRGYETFLHPSKAGAGNDSVRRLFEHVGVSPTPLKVFTNDAASPVGGGAVANFRAGDNCFLNADVLGECEKITMRQANILAFERGAYPVVETGPLHQLIDQGDWYAELDVGLRPAVFVEVRNLQKRGFVIGGGFLGDGYESISGFVPGVELNEKAAKALVDKALRWSVREQSFESSLYQDLHDFERGLGDILIARLPAHEVALLKQAELREIIQAVVLNWSKVCDLFDYSSAAEFSMATTSLPAGARRYLSHPIRLNFEPDGLGPTAIENLEKAAKEVRKSRRRLAKKA
ncbi:MAG: hypothetical protein AB3N07_09330 [Ruegeria sp.]